MRFISAKQMALLLFIQSTYSTTEKYTGNPLDKIETDKSFIYHLFTLEYPGPQCKSATRLIGKRIILPPARTESSEKFIPNAKIEIPYEGAKGILLFDDFENKELLAELFEKMYEELPMPKIKKKK